MKLKWVEDRYGSSYMTVFANWFVIQVVYDIVPQPDSEKYYVSINGKHLKKRFGDFEQARRAAEMAMEAIMKDLIEEYNKEG